MGFNEMILVSGMTASFLVGYKAWVTFYDWMWP